MKRKIWITLIMAVLLAVLYCHVSWADGESPEAGVQPEEDVLSEIAQAPEAATAEEPQTPEAASQEPAVEVPAAEEPAEVPAAEEPTEEPAAEESTEAPAAEEPTEEPAAEEPAAEELAVEEEPTAELPAEQTTEEETVAEPVAEEPTEGHAEEPIAEEPIAEELLAEEPQEEEVEHAVAPVETEAGEPKAEPATKEPEAEPAAGEMVRSLSVQVGDHIITACGDIPEGAEIQAAPIPAETAETMTSKELLFAYDIRLVVDGEVWQPEEHGTSIQISVEDLSGDLEQKDIDIVHVKTDLMGDDGTLSEEAVEKAIEGLQDGTVKTERIDTDTVDGGVSFDTGSCSGFLGTAMVKLQTLFKDAMTARKDGDTSVRLELSKDTRYEGDVEFFADQYGVGNDFAVELIAEDAGEDHLQSEGTTVVAGNVNIKGLIVRMFGVNMATENKVTVENGTLEYYGTAKDDALTVEVTGSESEANILTGQGNDTVTLTLDAGKASVETDEGDDSVTVVLRNKAAAEIDTGDGNDTVAAQLTGESKLILATGEGKDTVGAQVQDHSGIVADTDVGNDTVSVQITTEGQAVVSTGDGDDTVSLQVGTSTAKSVIDTGDGNDTVTVDARAGFYEMTVSTGDGDDTVNVQHGGEGAANPAGILTVDMGDGMDQANVDLSVADAAERVVVRGGGSGDRLHVTGELNKDKSEDERATGGESNMVLQGANNALNIEVYDVETVTDSLKNKRTVTVEQGATEIEAKTPFTNYVYKAPAGTIGQLTVTADRNANLALCDLVIDTATTLTGDNKLTVNQNAVIDARGVNLILRAKEIKIDGVLKAKAIVLDAAAGTGVHDRNFSELRNEINQSLSWFPLPDVVDAGAAVVAGADMVLDLLNVNDEASVVIGEHAELYSAGDVLLNAKVAQDGGIITLLPFLNPVNVKIAGAHVDVAGKVYAGYDFTAAQVTEGQGSVRMDADVKITADFQSDGKTYSGLPVGVTVAIGDAGVHVAEDALIEAGRDVTATSQTNIKIYNRADSGVGGLPVAVAATVLVNDADTTVEGTLRAKTGSVAITAGGTADVVTLADKGSGQTMISGGYVGASVALQNVRAQIAEGAAVTAGGSVKVKSTANELVKTAAAAEPDTKNDVEGGLGGAFLGALAGYLPQIKDKILPKYSAKWEEAIQKLATSSTSVQVDQKAKEHGDVSVETAVTNGEKWATVTVTPADGFKVKRIVWRGADPGAASYEYGASITNVLIFPLRVKNVTVFVEYEEAAKVQAASANALFAEKAEPADADPLQMVSDVVKSTAEEQSDEEKEDEGSETSEKLSLTLKGTGGAVLTYDLISETPGKCLDKVSPGQKLRLVPNPAQGKKLKQGGLKLDYEVTEEGKSVKKTVVINADDQGHYVADIPTDADKKAGITVSAEFVDADNKDAEADDTQVQVTGTIAVTVARNDNKALIADSATVTAGGSLEVSAATKTQITTEANGSAISKAGAKAAPKKDNDAIQRPQSIAYTGFDAAGRYYGLMIDGTENGDVTYVQNGPDGAYSYTFTATPKDARFQVTGAAFIYYSEGKRTALTLEPDANGKYNLDILNISGAMDKGTVGLVCFTFGGPAYREEHVYHQDAQVIIPNPIKITYNALKKEKENAIEAYTGKIYFKNTEIENGKIKAYVFDAVPELNKGYVLDGKPKASWVMLDGTTKEVELTRREGDINRYWYLDPKDVPVGALITVTGTFKNDLHTFKVDTENTKNGTVTLHDSQVKTSDAPKITITPNAGYSLDEVTVTMPGSGNTVTLKKQDLTVVGEGKYQFTVTPLREDAEVKVSATFKLKSIGLYASDGQSGEGHDTDQFQLSAYNAAKGDAITVTPNAEKVKQGYKISQITVKDSADKTVVQTASATFTVPNDTADDAKLTVTAEMKLKEVALEKATLEHGTVTPAAAYADRGDKVTVTVKPADNYRLKKGTLKAVINATDGSYTEEVYMARADDNTYTFLMPEGIEDPAKVKLTFAGEFVPGQSDTSAVQTSLGAGAAVSVVNSESRAEIGKATATASGNIAVTATQTGGVKTGVKAGYSKGNVGIGGAVAVQVASMDSKALIQEGASLTLGGHLKLQAEGETDFSVSADASGNPVAQKAGVGAGIAVAVNGSDVAAAVADGVKLVPKTQGNDLKGISAVAARKGTDSVTAKAGAAGGASVVPVAAVDVTGTSAVASLGKVANGMLPVTSTALSATNNMFHTVSADAASAGQGVGLGAAFGVSVLSDTADATLQQSVKGEKVTVASETVSSLTSTVTASASGGDAKKSADQQTDGLLGTASQLAGKNGSASVSPSLINGAKDDRQQAETTEGTVGGAGAVAVNVQHSRNTSFIADGVDVQADDLVAVKAQNGTVAKIKANGSTTNSDVGVGIGVAVNVVDLTNEARIGNGQINAGTLEVTATTKAATPAKKKAAPKVQTKDQLSRQLADALRSYLRDLMKEMGMDGYVPDDILGPIVENVTAATVEQIIKVTGLDKLLGSGDLDDKYEAAVKLLTKKGEGLMDLPAELIAPFLEALQDLEGFSELTVDDLARIAEAVESEFTTQLVNKLPTVGNTFLDHVKGGMLKYLKDHAAELVSGLWNGGNIKSGAGDVLGKLLKEAGQEVLRDAKTALQTLANDLFQETLDRVSIPGLTPQKADQVLKALKSFKDAYQKDDYSLIFENAAKRVSSIFCAEVFDYEAMLSKFAKDDFKKQLVENIKSVLKTASVTLTNEAISTLTSHADLVLASQVDRFNGHTVNTQAISGAGARDVGMSGSVAITVLNASTVAELTDEGKAVCVSGEMKVDAQEKRLVRNVASAALDAKGNASANKSAKTAANADVGDAATTVKGGKVTLTLGVGVTGEIRQGDQADERPKIRLTLKDGYKMPENNEIHYSFTDEGFEASGTIAAQKDDDGWYVDPNSGDLANVPKGTDISLVLAPEAILYSIPSPAILTAKGMEEGAVTITAKDGTVENDTLRTHIGDKVEVKVANEKGRKIAGIGYSYKDDEGQVHDISLAKSSATKTETVFLFNMPGFDVVDFVVQFDDDTGEENRSETAAQDATGKCVGVGAAFSMIYGNSDVHALIGTRGSGADGLKAGALTLTATSAHQEDVASAAGTDPLTGQWNADAAKKTGADAAVSLNILDNSIAAGITGSMPIHVGTAEKEGDLRIEATEDSVSESNASSFAVGGSTAMGATAAIDISDSQVRAILKPGAVVRGQVLISAESHSEDTTSAVATALGADIARMLNKVGQAADKLEEKSNKLLDGSYMDDIVKKGEQSQEKDKQTKAAEVTNKRLESVKAKDGDKTSGQLSTSSNVLRSLGVKKEGPEAGSEGTEAAAAQIKDKTGQDVSTDKGDDSKHFQVAAAVGVTVSSHSAQVEIGGNITADKVIALLADNTGNFATMGTAAAMSKADHANSIAAGVAVGVNSNKATVDVQGDLVSADTLQGVVAGSRLTQNLDGAFAGKLAVQALAGSVAGKDSDVSLGGAISVLVSQGESAVRIADGTKEAPRQLKGGRVTVEAMDQSRLTGRAGGLSLSKGSSVGMGVASTTLVSANTVEASIGDYTKIDARELWLNAAKLPVTDEDYHSTLSLRTLITDSSQLTEEERATAKTGLIDAHKAEGESSYTVKVNLSEQKLLEAVDGLNFLSGRNIYAEAIAGSLMTGGKENSKASTAGSFAVAVTQNTVRSLLGDNTIVTNSFGPLVNGHVNVNATNGNNIRVIAGSLSASPAKANVGATVAVLTMLDDVLAEVGDNANITAANSFRMQAATEGEAEALVTNTEVDAPKLTVSSTWDSTATSDFIGVQVGAIPVGISVNYADNHEENRATVNAFGRGGADFSGDVEVIAAGDSTVAVETMAGNAGAINVGVNTAIARNRRENLATLTSADRMTVDGGLIVKSEGKADASAKGLGVQMGAMNIGASVVVALNDAVNDTKAELASSLNVGGETKLTADMQDTTLAQLQTGSGSLIGVNVNVAAAYGRTKATVDASVNNNSAFHGFTASATGKGETTSKIENYSFDVIAAAVMVGNAYSQEEYATRVQLNWDKNLNYTSYGNTNCDWLVETRYDVTTVADVAPSAGGVDVNLGKIMYNQAKARNSAKADTVLSLTGGYITSGKDLKVNTEGRSSAKADLRTAELTLSALNIGVGRAISENAMEANARMEMKDFNVKIDGAFSVTSLVDEASANSRIGGSGSKNPTRVSLVSGDDNEARAYEKMTVSAALLGTHEYKEQNLVDASGFTIESGMKEGKQSGAWAASNGAEDYSLATIGNLEAEAVVTETIRAKMDGVIALIEGGEAKILALGNAVSSGVGSAPGSLRAIDGGRSNVTAKMGADGARQSVRVEIGSKSNDTGIWSRKDMEIRAENQGSATAEMVRKGAYSLLNVNSSSQPTESWFDTGVTIFREAGLSTNGNMTVSSLSGVTAQSKVDNESLGLVLNVDTMKGENKADDINRLILEDGAALNAEGDLTLLANTDFNIDAETIYQGGYDFIGSTSIQALNNVKRDVNLWIGNDVTLLTNGALNVRCMSDLNSGHVLATAQQHVDDVIAFARAEATTKAMDYCTLSIGQRDIFRAKGKVVIESRTTAKKGDGYYADALVFIHKDDIKLYGAPEANATVNLDTRATVVINRDGYYMTSIRNEETGGIYVSASNGQLSAFSNTDVRAASVYTKAFSTARTHVDADNCIWVDRTEFSSPYSAKLFAQIGDGGNARLNSNAFVSLQVAGSEYSTTTVEGSMKTTIRTSDPHHVRGPETFVHKTYSSASVEQHARCKGNDYVTSHNPSSTDNTSYYRYCDLCEGTSSAPRALQSIVVKTMLPLHDVPSEDRPDASISVARFGGKDDRIAGEKYVLNYQLVLTEDTAVSKAQMDSMKLWANKPTGLDAYLLPNAARFFVDGEGGLRFISEVLHGDAFLDGEADDIDIFTALTPEAFAEPVVPIGSSSSLDFRNGLPSLAEFVDFELYVHEVSGAWFHDRFSDGFFRMLSADQNEINNCALRGFDLPQGRITEGLVEGEAIDERRLYWIGATPDTALSPDETLIFMLLDEETDEADFFRTSVNMLQRGEAPVDQSLYLYRDSKSDRSGVEKYNIMFFDTPKGQKSLVKTVTDVLGDRQLETPTALKITLRRFYLEGADLPAYALFNHVFIMNDLTDGESSVLDGQYEATFRDGVFESDYTWVEGILTGELNVILKAGDDVWLMWVDALTAQDPAGDLYRLANGAWGEAFAA